MADQVLVYGLGVTGVAVVRALIDHGIDVVAVDDRVEPSHEVDAELEVETHRAPTEAEIEHLVKECSAVIPAPGLPDTHSVIALADRHDVPLWSEFDLAGRWDDRPLVAITGTDGKTTVTTLVVTMLERSGLAAVGVGNTDIPLVAAIADPSHDVFVVEASSFRLGRSQVFRPDVGAWLNFAHDHLDVHRDIESYEAAKAQIWRDQRADQVAIGNLDDPVVARHLSQAPGRHVGFGGDGSFRVEDNALVIDGEPLLEVAVLPRQFPHDLANALAAAACALEMGSSLEAVVDTLRSFRGLPHRLQLVAEIDGVRWLDDSKATVPHATVSAVRAFDEVVLVAGGRNKGLDLSSLADASPSIVGVVGIGESGPEVVSIFSGRVPGTAVDSMEEAVQAARDLAQPGQVVLLSPGCASFDWYGSYGERGDDFTRLVTALANSQERR